jgi:hypothetical protein
MNIVLKRILIASGLVVFCGAIFAGVKFYGVWVISVVAVVLFIAGMLRKDKSAGSRGDEGTTKRGGNDGG